MGRAKEISLKVIPGKVANPFVRRHHYSGTVVNNSCLHFGGISGRAAPWGYVLRAEPQ